jgi:nucleotide-binding universal stress UspA family protein
MSTLLVPIDFSENAFDAAQYAVRWSDRFDIRRIILYHSNRSKSKSDESLLGELDSVKLRLIDKGSQIEIICIVNSEPISEGVVSISIKYDVSLIVMGITGRNKIGQKLIGSSVFEVSERTNIPVLIIPPNTRFEKINNIALALPIIEELKSYVPEQKIKMVSRTLGTNMIIVNVSKRKDNTPRSILYATLKDVFEMFDDLHPTYHFLTARNTADSVADFATENRAQLLISIAGKYGFLQGMFKSSVTKRLAYRSSVPLLIFRSEN